jgi:hypothetical protein
MASEIYRGILALHVALAALALAAFWGAAATRKGGALHRRFGRAFVRAMAASAASGAGLSGLALWDPLAVRPPGPELRADEYDDYAGVVREIAGSLLEVSGVTGALLWLGVRALRRSRVPGSPELGRDVATACGWAALGLVLLCLGLQPERPYLQGRGAVLALVGGLQLRRVLRTARSPRTWIVQHLIGMGGAGAVAHGALAVNVARRFTDDPGLYFGAALPVLLLFALGIWRMARGRAPRPRPGASLRSVEWTA